MLDAEFRSFLATLVVDISVFTACLFVFAGVKTKWYPESIPLLGPASMIRQQQNAFENSDVRLYLTFLQIMTVLFGVMTVFGLLIIMPIHETATWQVRASILGSASAENYRQSDVIVHSFDARIYAMFAMVLLFTIFTYVAIRYFHDAISACELDTFPSETERVAHHCVMVKNLHRRQTDPDALLKALFGDGQSSVRYLSQLVQTSVVYNFQQFYDAEMQMQVASERVERFQLRNEMTQEKACVRGYGIVGPQHDAVNHFLEELIYRKKVFYRLLSQGQRLECAGIAFIVFGTPETQRDMLTDAVVQARAREHEWVLEAAPPPGDLAWKNLHISTRLQQLRVVGFSFLLFVLCWVLVSPVTVWDRLHFLLLGVKQELLEDNLLRIIITGYLPPLVILGINNLVIPECIWYAAKWVRWWRKSERERMVLHMNIIFMVINSMIIPLTCFNSLESLVKHMVTTPWTEWNVALGSTFLVSSGSLGLRYIVNSAFLSSSAQLLQIPQTFWSKCHLALAVTERDRQRALARWPFNFGFWYACCLSAFFMCLAFSTVVPLILPCGTAYFLIKYHLDYYNFARGVLAVNMESQGALARTVGSYMWSGLAFFHFCMSGFFIVQKFKVLGCFLLMTSIGLSIRASVDPAASKIPLNAPKAHVKDLAVLENVYLHPWECARRELYPLS